MQIQTIGSNIIRLNHTSSTNNYSADLLNQTNVPNGTVVVTESQEKGKGQRGSSWESEPHKNLTFSIIIKKDFPVDRRFQLSMMTALSIYELMDQYNFDLLKVKWPNDVYSNNKKVSGILIENTIKGKVVASSIIGIGININQQKFNDSKAASFHQLSGKNWDKEQVLKKFLSIFNKNYMLFQKGYDFKDEYQDHSLGWSQFSLYQTPDGNSFKGKVVNYTKEGKIVIENRHEEQMVFDLKEVKFIS